MVEGLQRSAGRPAGGAGDGQQSHLGRRAGAACAPPRPNLAVNQAKDLPQVTLDGSEQRTLFSKDYIIPPPYGGSYRWYRLAGRQSQLEPGFLGQAGGADRQGAQHAPKPRRWMRRPRSWRCRAPSPRPISICCWTISMATSPTPPWPSATEILKITQGRFDAGLENGSAVEQAKSLLSIAKADQLRFAAAREMDIHAIAALAGQGAGAYATITRPKPNLDVALPLPDRLPADLLARRPDILAAQGAGGGGGARAARRRMPTSIPTSIWRRWWVSRPSACPTC